MRFSVALLPALLGAPAFAEPPQVVVDIAPVHALLSQVMEGVATPDLLLQQGDNPHAVQLKPSQARMLANADLVIWVGPELSPWLEDIVELEANDSIALTAHPATHLRAFGEGHEEHAHDEGDAHEEADHEDHDDHAHGEEGHEDHADMDHDEHDHDEHMEELDHDHADEAHAEDGHEGHDHTGTDPHVWLTTENARAWIDLFADTLSERDPDNAEAYRTNAADALVGIDALDAHIESRLAGHQGAEIVTFHDSYQYFAEEFGLVIAGSVRPGDASTPSAAALSELKELVAEHGVECAFAEPAHDPALLDAIAGGTGLRIGLLDPTGTLQPLGQDLYAGMMTAAAEAIADCLEGE